ncbi:MAG: quinol dehydrogenase ferredoxin subunit NapH [Gammaproteobacteria bacterium]
MAIGQHIGQEAVVKKGWIAAHKWLLLRRVSQIAILGLFLLGPLAGIWWIKGNLSASLFLDTVPMTDPFIFLQSLLAGHVETASAAVTGVLIVLAFYLVVGGRVFCSWVCPVNLVTDTAFWLRRRLGLRSTAKLGRNTRYWLLVMTLVMAFATGTLAWELVNPVSIVHRSLIFGMGFAWLMILAIFLFDLFVARRGWCSHLCPQGALYGLIGYLSPVRVRADRRAACDDCKECYVVCPEPQVITPALKGGVKGLGPVISSGVCTNCGRCIDVCAEDVFQFGTRFNKHTRTTGVKEKVNVA